MTTGLTLHVEVAKTHFIILKHLGMRTTRGEEKASCGLGEEPYAHVCIPKVSEALRVSQGLIKQLQIT